MIDCKNNNVYISSNNSQEIIDDYKTINSLEISEESTNINFAEATREIDTISEEQRQQLNNILRANARVFREQPGRISGHEHELHVMDESTFFKKSWPIPWPYQDKVQEKSSG